MPNIFLISGPSGSGQDSVIEGLRRYIKFNRVITTVTRSKLSGEHHGKPYYFTSKEKFKKLIKQRAFIEWARVYGDYRGCTKKEIKRLMKKNGPIIWKVDWQGVKTIKKIFPSAVSISITSSSYGLLERRLVLRGRDTMREIKKRKKETLRALTKKDIYDYMVENKEGKLEKTIKKVSYIINQTIKIKL